MARNFPGHRRNVTVVAFAGFVMFMLDAGMSFAAGAVQLGPRPFYLVDELVASRLRDRLVECAATKAAYVAHPFSIGHRGAPLQFPEHTEQSYRAAARMGAGIVECDVTFTKDGELVCRHAQCDLHATTNILATPLARSCKAGFKPAKFEASKTGSPGKRVSPASAKCCASDLTLAEFKSLSGKMDGVNPWATTVRGYLAGTPGWRTELYSTGGTLMSHKESIKLFRSLGVKMTPELKSAPEGFGDTGLDQTGYAERLIQDYVAAGVPESDVYPQSFKLDDIRYWIANHPAFGRQAVLLDGRYRRDIPAKEFVDLFAEGVRIVAPPMQILLSGSSGKIVPSNYAMRATEAGLALMTWTTERSGRVREDIVPGKGAFYYRDLTSALTNDGDILRVLDVLARDVGVLGVFSDWPATTTFYANCSL